MSTFVGVINQTIAVGPSPDPIALREFAESRFPDCDFKVFCLMPGSESVGREPAPRAVIGVLSAEETNALRDRVNAILAADPSQGKRLRQALPNSTVRTFLDGTAQTIRATTAVAIEEFLNSSDELAKATLQPEAKPSASTAAEGTDPEIESFGIDPEYAEIGADSQWARVSL